MNHPSAYEGKTVVVIGMAKSGVAVAKLFRHFGADVVVNDSKEREACPEADDLEASGIAVICGGHPDTLIHEGVALVVKNPGVPYHIAPIQQAIACNIEVVTEVEVAYHISKAPIIGITGSNGKTTTTTLVGLMLERAGMSPIVAGNIGRPLSEVAMQATEQQWLVVELSSFQLKGTDTFRPAIGCLLNLCETHLDYHGTMEDYILSKTKLFHNQSSGDQVVLNGDDSLVQALLSQPSVKPMLFSMKRQVEYGVYVANTATGEEQIIYRDAQGVEHPVLHIAEIRMPGRHNVENALAAAAIAICAGAPLAAIVHVLKEFRGVEHRNEFVASRNNVDYYNDSKATNPLSTMKALEAFKGPIVLIAGGLDRGMLYDSLVPYLKERGRALVAFGETREKFIQAAEQAGIPAVAVEESGRGIAWMMEQAVQQAAALAQPGDIVLLSPACASWDMFDSFEQRGSMFKQAVHNL